MPLTRQSRPKTSSARVAQAPPPEEPVLSAAEREALARVKKGEDLAAAPGSRKRNRSKLAANEVRTSLRSPAGLKKAVLLKEVLDRPVGLRNGNGYGA